MMLSLLRKGLPADIEPIQGPKLL